MSAEPWQLRLAGRPIRVGRPQNYVVPVNGELPPLDVQPLRERGILPLAMEETDLGKAWERLSLVSVQHALSLSSSKVVSNLSSWMCKFTLSFGSFLLSTLLAPAISCPFPLPCFCSARAA